MKAYLLLPFTVLAAFLAIINGNNGTIADARPLGVVSCALPPPLLSSIEFEEIYLPPATTLKRRNVDLLSAADINAIKTSIAAMKALPYTNPTSWTYQANIHGTTMTDNLPSWNSCHRSGQAFFFLAWHRMYVYFFGCILRLKSGNPILAIPYRNYQLNPLLRAELSANEPGSPLYDSTRSIQKVSFSVNEYVVE